MSKKHNFSAGPCILPQDVLKKASEAIINFNNDKGLERTIDSVKEQINKSYFEYIIIDGGSNDNSIDVIIIHLI